MNISEGRKAETRLKLVPLSHVVFLLEEGGGECFRGSLKALKRVVNALERIPREGSMWTITPVKESLSNLSRGFWLEPLR